MAEKTTVKEKIWIVFVDNNIVAGAQNFRKRERFRIESEMVFKIYIIYADCFLYFIKVSNFFLLIHVVELIK